MVVTNVIKQFWLVLNILCLWELHHGQLPKDLWHLQELEKESLHLQAMMHKPGKSAHQAHPPHDLSTMLWYG